jgi:predicted PurR-regulated permease PerM
MSETAKAFGRTFAILGLAFGLLALLLSFVPVIGIIAAAPGVIAFIASFIAVLLARRGNAPLGLSTVALAISTLGLLIALIWGLIFYQATKKRELPEQQEPEAKEMVQHQLQR